VAEVRHSRRARSDLKRIWRYIALDSDAAADRCWVASADVSKISQSSHNPAASKMIFGRARAC